MGYSVHEWQVLYLSEQQEVTKSLNSKSVVYSLDNLEMKVHKTRDKVLFQKVRFTIFTMALISISWTHAYSIDRLYRAGVFLW
jgi:hypothetical protein